ncbi:MAG: D-Ala-D-Ala carboxypeptidase family metallohydrolase [Magnetococcus sp. THC-1_WYH]
MEITPVDWSEIRHFKRSEFVCRCGCGVERMDHGFVQFLDELREIYGKPMKITSGYRCPMHNAAVSKTGHVGPHTTGLAVDIACHGYDALMLMRHAILMTDRGNGITGYGMSQKGPLQSRFAHLDRLQNAPNSPRPWIWTY